MVLTEFIISKFSFIFSDELEKEELLIPAYNELSYLQG